MTDVADPPSFSLQQTRYRVLGPLGRGGMATVYRARDTALGRDVALKLFAAQADDVAQLRAQQREAQLLASFRHHSLVTLFDAGVDFDERGTPRMFLTMELIDGPDLRERLRRGPLPLLSVAHIGFDLADALAYLHDRGVTHRDLKPANVLLVERPGTRLRVKLADFGIAQIGEEHGDPEETTGTAAYLSPEQAAGEPVRQPSDVYSLGLLLLEAITGRVVFPGGVIESALARLDRSPTVPDDLPTHWRELLTAMTARRAADRPSAAEVAIGFRQVLVDELAAAQTDGDAARLVSRTAAVRRYDLLSGREDAATDRICALAARLLGADAAVVAVHDDDRLLVKSRTGTGWGEDVQGVLEEEPLDVPEVGPAEPPLAAMRPGTRGYASAPARTADGLAVATLAVLFDEPRRLTADERSTLQDLADAVLHEAEMRRAVRRLLLGPAA